jgi:hypothetical protein
VHTDCRIKFVGRLVVWASVALSSGAACGGTETALEGAAGTGAQDSPATGVSGASATPRVTATAGTTSQPSGGSSSRIGTSAAGAPASGGAGGAALAAGSGAAAGSVGAAGGVAAAGSSAAAGSVAAAGSGGGTAPVSGATGSLPAITDPGEPGQFTPVWKESEGPGGNYTTIVPMELATSERKHPILIWGPGAGAYPEIYKSLLDHIVTHGFVIVSYNTTPQGPELNEAIDWIVEQSTSSSSPFNGKLDTTKIAMGGQSAGSLATFQAGGDERLTTTLHINGGTFDGNVRNLKKPAFFVCGDDPAVSGGDGTWESDLARPNCDRDFENIEIPVWYGVVVGSSHTTVIDNPMSGMPQGDPGIKKAYLASAAAWLRWQLAGDETLKTLFVGQDCGYCKDSATWLVQQKELD